MTFSASILAQSFKRELPPLREAAVTARAVLTAAVAVGVVVGRILGFTSSRNTPVGTFLHSHLEHASMRITFAITSRIVEGSRPVSRLRRSCAQAAFFVVCTLFFSQPTQMHAQNISSTSRPKWTIELKNYGWHPPKVPSNKAFFKDLAVSKLEGVDQNTRVLFVSNDILVAYHTKVDGQDWRTATRQLEAFFVSAKDGSLRYKKKWQTWLRKSSNDLRDSESRLIGLQNGRFLVLAAGTMMFYESTLDLLKQQKLEPLNSTDLWAIQGVSGGREIFLRHETSPDVQVTYKWLASDTLRLLYEMPGYRNHDFSVQAGVVAGDDAVFAGSSSGIRMMGTDQRVKTICDDQLCRGDIIVDVLNRRSIGFSGRTGIGVVDEDNGLIWSKATAQEHNPNDFQFGGMRSATSGNSFAVWVTAYRKSLFDGIEVSSSPILFVYDAANPKLLRAIPIERQSGDFDFALSPDGKQLAIFDGVRIRLYTID